MLFHFRDSGMFFLVLGVWRFCTWDVAAPVRSIPFKIISPFGRQLTASGASQNARGEKIFVWDLIAHIFFLALPLVMTFLDQSCAARNWHF